MPDTWDAMIDTSVLAPLMDVFGTTVTYQPTDGTSFVITGVFDTQFLSLSPQGKGQFGSTEAYSLGSPGAITTATPVLGVQLSQFPSPPLQGDTLSLLPAGAPNAVTYSVREVQPDSHGGAKLILKKTTA